MGIFRQPLSQLRLIHRIKDFAAIDKISCRCKAVVAIVFLHLQKAVPSLSQLLGDWLVMGDVMTADLSGLTLPLVLAFLLLYLPLLPVRRILTAAFSAARRRHIAQSKTAEPESAAARSVRASQETSDVPMVEAPVVPEWVKRETAGLYPQNQQSVEE